ncbi:nuclear transport factor 2 family protein [Eoetvoesiella caeni]
MNETRNQEELAVLRADDERYGAMIADNLAVLDQLLDSDLVYTHSSAIVDTKRQYLDSLRDGRVKYVAADRRDAVVAVYGPIALMHGQTVMQAIINGTTKQLNNLFQAVWIQREGNWRLLAWASTVIPAKR